MNSILHHRQPRGERASGKPQRKSSRKAALLKWFVGGLSLSVATAASIGAIAWRCSEARYDAAPAMRVPLAAASSEQYNDRRLLLVQRDATHYDLILEPASDRVARVVLSNIDVSPLAPQVNATGYSAGLAPQLTIDARDERVEIVGGDGFEAQHLASISITAPRGAGHWQVALAADADGVHAPYYQGEFQFPLGHFRELFESTTGLHYADYRHELEADAPLVAEGQGGIYR